MPTKKRKADIFAGKGSIAGALKEYRDRVESGDLAPNPQPTVERTTTPVDSAQARAQARLERLRKLKEKKPF